MTLEWNSEFPELSSFALVSVLKAVVPFSLVVISASPVVVVVFELLGGMRAKRYGLIIRLFRIGVSEPQT